jgi:hypothetical protein
LARSGSALGCAVAEQGTEGAEAVQDRAFQTPSREVGPVGIHHAARTDTSLDEARQANYGECRIPLLPVKE